jgi:hypothetical protein
MDDSTVPTSPAPRQPHESDCEMHANIERWLDIAYQVAFAGWSAAIILAALLIELVIA